MLEQPDIPDATIVTCLHNTYGLRVAEVRFLPLGWVNNALYRVIVESGASYLLKLRRGHFSEAAVAVPALLHARGIRQAVAPITTTSSALWVRAPLYRRIWLNVLSTFSICSGVSTATESIRDRGSVSAEQCGGYRRQDVWPTLNGHEPS